MSIAEKFNPNVGRITLHPGLSGARLQRSMGGLCGVVLEAFGTGHVSSEQGHLRVVERFTKPVVLCTQAFIQGIALGGYDRDREIQAVSNLIPAADMLPETALVKLMWCLGQRFDVRHVMMTDVALEVSSADRRNRSGW
jgi:L-asparaginase/Glu-tRNA(Gln) amidotransferase subunit D